MMPRHGGGRLIAVAPLASARSIGLSVLRQIGSDAFAGNGAAIVHTEMALIRRLINAALNQTVRAIGQHVREDDDA
jgi:hypothetical protein